MIQNISETVSHLEWNKTAGLLSFHCMTKEFRNCKIDVDGYDPKGIKVFSEKNIEAGTYKIKFNDYGEYRISFYNKDVRSPNARKLRSTCRSASNATTAARSSWPPRIYSSKRTRSRKS
jgi:hypothetical protein